MPKHQNYGTVDAAQCENWLSYHSANVITLSLSQSDHIKRLPLYLILNEVKYTYVNVRHQILPKSLLKVWFDDVTITFISSTVTYLSVISPIATHFIKFDQNTFDEMFRQCRVRS